MIRFFIIDDVNNESSEDFAKRVNAEIDALRDANLVINYTPIPGASLTIYAQIGAQEPVVAPNGQMMGMGFKDLSVAEVEKRIGLRKAALARGPSVLRN